MMKNHHLAKSIQDLGLGRFIEMLQYKAKWKGGNVIKISRWFPSSKLCSCCGHKKEKLGLDERIYVCEHCGLNIDRDLNAAINIYKEGIRLYKLFLIEEEKQNNNKVKIGILTPELTLEDCTVMDDKASPLKSNHRMIQESKVIDKFRFVL